MRLATVLDGDVTRAARLDGDDAVVLDAPDVGALLRMGGRGAAGTAAGRVVPVDGLRFAPLVPEPTHVWCIGLNYASHAEETGVPVPEHPTVFTKMPGALIGHGDDIVLPDPLISEQVDWEAELVVVVGADVRHADEATAAAAIAGYTVGNDISVRDWQLRTGQWTLGKTFESTTPVGPWLVTADEIDDLAGHTITCEVNGATVQQADLDDLVFGPAALIAHLSQAITLRPGDLVFTGTPSGVALSREGQPWLKDGDEVRTRIDGIGELVNRCRRA